MAEEKVSRLLKLGLSEYQAKTLTKAKEDLALFEATIRLPGFEQNLAVGTANLIINKKIDVDKTKPEEILTRLTKKKMPSVVSQEELKKKIEIVVKNHPQVVADFQKGKETVVEFLVGQVMRQTKGQADPQQVRKILREKLKSA